jgi:hypothetical protein
LDGGPYDGATLPHTDCGPSTEPYIELHRAGLPAPETQIEFVDEFGVARIRIDMGWRERSWDIERIAMLEALGWVVVRVSAEMLSRPNVIIERVVAKLRAAGCPI